jgi:hypothetical protein
MKKKISVNLVLVCFAFFSCNKPSTGKIIYTTQQCYDLKKDSFYLTNDLIGTWKWIEEYKYNQTTGEKIITSPTTAGYNKYVIFDKTNTYTLYKNNEVIEDSKYKINRLFKYTNYPSDSNFVLGFHRKSDNVLIDFYYLKPCNDTLVLNGGAFNDDGSVITYIRN